MEVLRAAGGARRKSSRSSLGFVFFQARLEPAAQSDHTVPHEKCAVRLHS